MTVPSALQVTGPDQVAAAVAQMRAELAESCRIKQSLSDDLLRSVWVWTERACRALQAGGAIFFFGNGGSAADAQHLAAELAGKFLDPQRRPLPAAALATNISTLTAIANDFSFADVFARQIRAFARRGDVVVGISTSGKSENVIRGLVAARALGAVTVCLTGQGGETLRSVVDILLAAPSADTQRLQEVHITLGHMFCRIVDSYFSHAAS